MSVPWIRRVSCKFERRAGEVCLSLPQERNTKLGPGLIGRQLRKAAALLREDV